MVKRELFIIDVYRDTVAFTAGVFAGIVLDWVFKDGCARYAPNGSCTDVALPFNTLLLVGLLQFIVNSIIVNIVSRAVGRVPTFFVTGLFIPQIVLVRSAFERLNDDKKRTAPITENRAQQDIED
jgi:hypothetical protein